MIDAGMRTLTLLTSRPGSRARVLLFIAQPMDSGCHRGHRRPTAQRLSVELLSQFPGSRLSHRQDRSGRSRRQGLFASRLLVERLNPERLPDRQSFFSGVLAASPASGLVRLRKGFTLPSALTNRFPAFRAFSGAASCDAVASSGAVPNTAGRAASSASTESVFGASGSGASTSRRAVVLGAGIA